MSKNGLNARGIRILFTCFSLLLASSAAHAYTLGGSSGWLNRKSHVINSATGAGTNYPVMIIVQDGSGTDSGSTVYVNGKVRSDFGDVRFTNSDGDLLDYWAEEVNADSDATFWVEVDGNLGSAAQTIYIYYNKDSATSASNGENTFLLFDDFEDGVVDTGKWSVVSSGTAQCSEADGYAKITGTNSGTWYDGYWQSQDKFGPNHGVRAKQIFAQTADNNYEYTGFQDFGGNDYVLMELIRANWIPGSYSDNLVSAKSGSTASSSITQVRDAWRVYDYVWTTSRAELFSDGSSLASITDTDDIPVSNVSASIRMNSGAGAGYIHTDWLLVRKRVLSEPAHGAWGGEESDNAPPSPTVDSVGGDSSSPWSTSDTTPSILITLNENGDCRASESDEAYDDMSDDVDCSGDGGTSITCQMGSLAEASIDTVYVSCKDTDGNKDTIASNEHITLEIDATPPSPSGYNPSSGSTITSTSQTLTFNTDETGDCYASLDGDEAYDDMSDDFDCTAATATSHSCSLTGLSVGSNTVFIACKDDTDASANKDTASTNEFITLTVDTAAPSVTVSSVGGDSSSPYSTSDNTPLVVVTTNENADCRASTTDESYDGMSDDVDCSGDGSTSITCQMGVLFEASSATIYVACRDATGNKDTVASNEHVLVEIDATPPAQAAIIPHPVPLLIPRPRLLLSSQTK